MSSVTYSNNKRIAKNTIMLYLRQFLVMGVGLYTSRVVLESLGISDYGIYTLVGGFVSMLAYLNSVFVSATQRFISFELGTGDKERLKDIFSTSLTIHYALALIILIVAETFGVWFINNHLNIDPNRLYAAHWVFQCSLVSLMITIISVPYNSCLVAHEHMHVYAYISIIDVLMKLGIVFLLAYLPYDSLITYSVLMLVVAVTIRLCYTIYCKRHFEECHYQKVFDVKKFKEMSSYASWTMVGTLGFTVKEQISNIILNQFFGTFINAAKGVAGQVCGAINLFATNFFMAMSPQITKQYASGNVEESRKLVYVGAKITFFLLQILIIPVIINIEYILHLWLIDVPEYTTEFIIIILLSTLISSLSNSITTALQATGKIKTFQIGIALILLTELPIAYVLLRMGYPPTYALLPAIITNLIGILYRFYLLQKMLPQYSLRYYVFGIIVRCFIGFTASTIICIYFSLYFSPSFISLILTTAISIIVSVFVIYIVGLEKIERMIIKEQIQKKLLHKL